MTTETYPIPEESGFNIEPTPIVIHSIPVNKKTHRIRYENESEETVTVVIEPKETT